MTVFDYAVLFIIGVSILLSVMRGFLREVMALLAWVVAFWVANLYTAQFAPLLPPSIPTPELRLLAAFAALFEYFAPRIKAFMLRSGAGDASAEELAQETLLAVWRKATLFDPASSGAAACSRDSRTSSTPSLRSGIAPRCSDSPTGSRRRASSTGSAGSSSRPSRSC